ncbi:hypothetical protein RFI_36535 [Reticulomyxa filosa]|uniref:Uncharacterized protein n=1 Tax=Reticulomyxa filosa TaxID=46433 RepID=X6LJN7_RETFI|nr:hypothetical protein RFI_36535 [Reticulomyxa filosa]|eukprot:ETO00905.1 hypothetical protein RFI_36535 [Reticulomyxa filosa]
MDYLSCTEPISLKTLLTQRVTDVINNEPIPNIRNNIRRALGHLRFPACVNVYKELERVPLLFKDNVFEEFQAVIKQRLLSVLSIGPVNEPIAHIIFQRAKKRKNGGEKQICEGSFFEHYKHTIDKLVTMGLINILLACYENCYFQICFNGFERQMTELDHIFVSCAKSFLLLQIEEIKQVTSRLAEDTIELHVVPMKYTAQFPFSHLLHRWCQKQLVDQIVNNPKIIALDETIKMEEKKTEEIKTEDKSQSIAKAGDKSTKAVQSAKIFFIE